MIRMWASKRLMIIPGRMGVSILRGAIVVNTHVPLSNCKFPLLPKSEKTRRVSKGRTLGIHIIGIPKY